MAATSNLTPKMQRFVDSYALSGNAADAARQAGYSEGSARVTACRLLAKANISAALAARQAEYAAELQVAKADVMAQVLDAIEMGRKQERPDVLIQGAMALARLCGFCTPETVRAEVGLDAAAVRAGMASLSDSELLAMAQGRS